MSAECLRHPIFPDTYGARKRRREDSFTHQPRTVSGWLEEILESPFLASPRQQIMSSPSDGPSHHRVRPPIILPPPVPTSHPESWFTQLNQQGPGAIPTPFVDDEPPFYFPRPSPDTASSHVAQPDRLSSHAAQTSQPAPLSHSLLSQLELSEHDPNTYRDIIDDLTVQNQKLRRRLKRYVKDYSIATSQDGLFEVRVRRLPPGKRRELERILQDFLSTVPSSRERSNARSDDLRARASLRRQEQKNAPKPIQSPSPNMKGLDSAYSSISATGVTASAVDNRSNAELAKQATSDLGRVMLSDPDRVPHVKGDHEVSDVARQKVVVARLEMLFSGRESDEASMHGSNTQIETLKLESREGSTALIKGEASTTFVGEHAPAASETTSSVDFGQSAQAIDRRSDFLAVLPQQLSTDPDLPDSSPSRPSFDHWHHLRHLGAASPVAGSTPQPSDGWVYLNVLVNMAQLHTLNVTLDFVRQAIHDISENLALSEDGRKVRWCEERSKTHPGSTPAEANDDVAMSLDPPQASPSPQPKQTGDASQSAKDQRPAVAHTTSTYNRRRQLQAREFDYKPMFLHPKDRRLRHNNNNNNNNSQQQEYQDSSYESDTSSSSSSSSTTSEEPSRISRGGAGSKRSNDRRRGGPMVFFDHDPFFLDLSADPQVYDDANGPRSSYTDPENEAEPLGSHLPPTADSSGRYEKKREWAPDSTSPQSAQSSTSSEPPLEIYGNDSMVDVEGEEKAHLDDDHHVLEASGIGGIQLDDNLVIDVCTSHSPIVPSASTSQPSAPPPPAPPRPPQPPAPAPSSSASRNRTRPPPRNKFRTRILSHQTTPLPPSPLPPPSFVYPPLSDTDSENPGDGLEGFEEDTEKGGLEFCPVAVSPVWDGREEGEGDEDMDM
ncbi:MAG: hypothetical protein LQ350_001286 [Teloschistes chrysophthalmus]|nr:MAG: hypothetical protein LQ350_001286 [Niorma chrysophthalma]